jgi:hypothetical protein
MQVSLAITIDHNKPLRRLILVAFLIALAILSVHAVAKHGSDAVTAAQCADHPEIRMINLETGRIAMICMTEAGWGIYIIGRDGGNVTSFIKEKMARLEQVVRYMRNRGYEVIQ